MKSDSQIRSDVIDELCFDPSVCSENIRVLASEGVITLSGSVPSYADKYAAERATFRVAGVKAIADDIDVKLPAPSIRTDLEIAKAASESLAWQVQVPSTVTISVEDGVVILRGEVDWQYQRDAATLAIKSLIGVKAVKNRIKIHDRVRPADVRHQIEKALLRSAKTDSHQINVTTSDGKVTLSGHVRSYAEIEDAKWAAWAVPGVGQVENNLTVS